MKSLEKKQGKKDVVSEEELFEYIQEYGLLVCAEHACTLFEMCISLCCFLFLSLQPLFDWTDKNILCREGSARAGGGRCV